MFIILLLAPALLLISVFTLYPLLYGLVFSFENWNGFTSPVWVGLSNYARAFEDPFFLKSLWHNVIYAVFSVIGKMVIGILLAILVNQKLRGVTVYRTIIFIPVVLSFVAVGMLWSWVYNPVFGLLNSLLGLFGVHGNTAWLGSPQLALGSVIAVDIWKWSGYHMILFLAGLQSIPTELYEAAEVDGASKWQAFFRITLPLLVPILIINMMLAVTGAFNVFDLIYVMTNGGPFYASSVVATYAYTQAFQFHAYGYGTAMSYILLSVIILMTTLQIRLMRRFQQ